MAGSQKSIRKLLRPRPRRSGFLDHERNCSSPPWAPAPALPSLSAPTRRAPSAACSSNCSRALERGAATSGDSGTSMHGAPSVLSCAVLFSSTMSVRLRVLTTRRALSARRFICTITTGARQHAQAQVSKPASKRATRVSRPHWCGLMTAPTCPRKTRCEQKRELCKHARGNATSISPPARVMFAHAFSMRPRRNESPSQLSTMDNATQSKAGVLPLCGQSRE